MIWIKHILYKGIPEYAGQFDSNSIFHSIFSFMRVKYKKRDITVQLSTIHNNSEKEYGPRHGGFGHR